MAKVTIEQRCNGPFKWETVGLERRPVPQGLCGTPVKVIYDDDDEFSPKLGDLIQKTGLKCDGCSAQGKEMLAKAERLRLKRINDAFRESRKGKSYSSEGGKEHQF